MALVPIDNYPQNEISGVYQNDSIWVQFNKTLDTSTVNYITVSVASPADGHVPLEGTVETIASTGGYADSIIKYSPDPGFDAFKRYGFFIQGGSQGIRSYDGDALDANLIYYFTTGGETTTNDSVAATGVPEASSFIPSQNLAVIATNPEDNDSNIPLDVSFIKVQFNDIIPTGINLYDKIKLTSKDVL